jgi:hypothetical protein
MRQVLRRRLRRLGTAMAAVVAASGTIVAVTAGPAHADSWFGPVYIYLDDSGRCLASDFSSRVYTYPSCDGPQTWTLQGLAAYDGMYVLWNDATKRCLMQFDFTRVITSKDCNGADPSFRWRHDYPYHLQNARTGRYLAGDESGGDRVWLTNVGIIQSWYTVEP